MKYKLAVGHAHPTIWASIRATQVDNEEVLAKIAQNNIGRPTTKKRQRAYENFNATQPLRHFVFLYFIRKVQICIRTSFVH